MIKKDTALSQKGAKPKWANAKRRKFIFYLALVGLPLLQFLVFYVYTNLNSMLLAFKNYEAKQGALGYTVTFAGLQNFKSAIKIVFDNLFMIKNSLRLFFWSTIIGLTLAMIFSFYIYKRFALSGIFKTMLFMPQIVSGVVFGLLFKYMVTDVYISFMSGFGKNVLGLLDNPSTKLITVLFYNVWISFGVSVLLFSGSMSGIDEGIVESAHLDGVNIVTEFIFITVPMIWPTLISFMIIRVAGIFTDQMSLFTLFGTGGAELSTLGYYLYRMATGSDIISRTASIPNFSVLASLGLILTAVLLPLTLLIRRAMTKLGPSVD